MSERSADYGAGTPRPAAGRAGLTAAQVLADPGFAPIKNRIIAHTGLSYYADKDEDLAGKIAARIERCGLTGCREYFDFLDRPHTGEAEMDALVAELTIGETYFFRHSEMFDALAQQVLPERIAARESRRRLRVWSAGCASGAEAYSIAILIRRRMPQLAGWDIEILGTDINRVFLRQAAAGIYDEWALRSVPQDIRSECFDQAGRTFVLRPQYRAGVSFRYHNLVRDPFPSLSGDLCDFDVILCRNVFIYFSRATVRVMGEAFRKSLAPGGWLLVGHAEPAMDLFGGLETVPAPGAILYRNRPTDAPASEPGPFEFPPAVPDRPAYLFVPVAAIDRMPPSPVQTLAMSAPTIAPLAAAPDAGAELDAVRAAADRGDWSGALAQCERLLQVRNMDAAVHHLHALVCQHLRQDDRAEAALRRAVYLDRNFALAHYGLGLLLQRTGRSERAVRSFRNVLELTAKVDPTSPVAHGEGMTAGDLETAARMNLEMVEGS